MTKTIINNGDQFKNTKTGETVKIIGTKFRPFFGGNGKSSSMIPSYITSTETTEHVEITDNQMQNYIKEGVMIKIENDGE
jgi:hypothetical protein